jgi:hypothetical protein
MNSLPICHKQVEKIKAGEKKHDMSMQKCMDANFILASAVILERLWSLAHQILIDTPRKKMMPATVCT